MAVRVLSANDARSVYVRAERPTQSSSDARLAGGVAPAHGDGAGCMCDSLATPTRRKLLCLAK